MLGGVVKRPLVEEIRRRVRDQVDRPVEVGGARGCVEGVAEGDLVADEEERLLGPGEELPEGPCVSAGGVVEALAAEKAVLPRVLVLPVAIRSERVALEVADVDVVEERLFDEWDVT